ncbi:MAG: hypothetical protein GVY24_05610 [Planctomycetes bacterium]|nr:hypothetical protein [Planctomycetota bacterium]
MFDRDQAFRSIHNNAMNVAFLDGHAAAVKDGSPIPGTYNW